MATGSEVIVDKLQAAGVEVCFGLPGVHNLALWEALRASPIRLVGVRHEQAAAYAADGYARATGRLGVALTTTGPGAANTLGAVGEAWASRSPVLVIATDIPSSLRRPGVYRGVLHETDGQAAMFAPVVKSTPRARWTLRRSRRLQPPRWRRRLLRRRGRRTWRSPTDLLSAEAPSVTLRAPATAGSRREAIAAAALLDGARRPLIWAGGGARDAAEDGARARRAARRARCSRPTARRGVLPPGHPCPVGLPPHVEAAGRLWDEADVVLAIGSDLDGVRPRTSCSRSRRR